MPPRQPAGPSRSTRVVREQRWQAGMPARRPLLVLGGRTAREISSERGVARAQFVDGLAMAAAQLDHRIVRAAGASRAPQATECLPPLEHLDRSAWPIAHTARVVHQARDPRSRPVELWLDERKRIRVSGVAGASGVGAQGTAHDPNRRRHPAAARSDAELVVFELVTNALRHAGLTQMS
jgi:hypothetical protein